MRDSSTDPDSSFKSLRSSNFSTAVVRSGLTRRARGLQSSETLTQTCFGRSPRAAIEQNEPSEPKIGSPRPPVHGRSRRLLLACQLLSTAEEQSLGPFLVIRNVAVHGEGAPRSRQ